MVIQMYGTILAKREVIYEIKSVFVRLSVQTSYIKGICHESNKFADCKAVVSWVSGESVQKEQ